MSSTDRHSSDIDWCEANYAYHPYIAEYVNTLSNGYFVVAAPLLIMLYKPYAKLVNKRIRLIWILYGTIGLCSMYFHATLSFLGQMLDELAILWMFALAYGLWLPEKYYNKFLGDNYKRTSFEIAILVIAIIFTIIAWLYPFVNGMSTFLKLFYFIIMTVFALMFFGLPTLLLLVDELKRSKSVVAKKLGVKCIVAWVLAVSCWVCDRVFCEHWITIGFDYLHAFFHVLIAYCVASLFTLLAYFEAADNHPELCPEISFWPMKSFDYGLPYVTVNEIPLTKISQDD